MESFVKIVNSLKETRISSKNSIIDVLQGILLGHGFFRTSQMRSMLQTNWGKLTADLCLILSWAHCLYYFRKNDFFVISLNISDEIYVYWPQFATLGVDWIEMKIASNPGLLMLSPWNLTFKTYLAVFDAFNFTAFSHIYYRHVTMHT